jgi:DNA (cytosine-5)-methyltransferase 1
MTNPGLIVDLFAGAGGASLGLEMALGRPVDVAINHNPEAVAIHAANHPSTRHFTQNIYDVPPRTATMGQPVDILWASPDCKFFSKAKGGKPLDRNIRDLAWIVVRWAQDAKPKLIFVENVEEFQKWGPLDRKGKPIKERAGETFREWVKAIEAEGYRVDWRCLRACDYGAPTIRRRLFIVARLDRKPISWPLATHGPMALNINPKTPLAPARPKSKLFRPLKPYRTAAECIDWALPVRSIFGRKKPLAENTLRRIAEGMRRYVVEAREPFIVPGAESLARRLNSTSLLDSATEASAVLMPADMGPGLSPGLAEALLSPLALEIGGNDRDACPLPLDRPFKTLLTREHKALVAASLVHYYGPRPGARPRCGSLAEPFRTLVARNHRALVAAFMVKPNHTADYYRCFRGQAVTEPLQTITQSPGFGLVTAFLAKYFGRSTVNSLADPVSTLCSNIKHYPTYAFLAKYYGTGVGQSLNCPTATVTTVDRFGLVQINTVPLVWIGGEAYIIIDIALRMLKPRELARAQGFLDGYIIDVIYEGKPISQEAQVAAIGNSVPPAFAENLAKANMDALDYQPPLARRKWRPSLFEGQRLIT